MAKLFLEHLRGRLQQWDLAAQLAASFHLLTKYLLTLFSLELFSGPVVPTEKTLNRRDAWDGVLVQLD